ncbi:hypothetical protein PsorP6_010710 [Peronosclerospora sorghi]|uniref:Uncharacterized protein n=1 Tax=Peronosclerospora sorghi TaxID=230839 RepID=A0ACC0VYP9_9STRA|nr:hypothetical protein PsorP6_010710 [Peronosclerospora sorghi]
MPPYDGSPEATRRQRQKVAYALQALKMYNPDFVLTPEVLEIMRAFFADLQPDDEGTITRGALADEIARLDPSAETRRYLRHEMARREEQLDFTAFCEWVMRWKVQNPQLVQNVYTSWAAQIAALDFGMSDGDSIFLDLKTEEEPSNDTLALEIIELLQRRQKVKEALRCHEGGLIHTPAQKNLICEDNSDGMIEMDVKLDKTVVELHQAATTDKEGSILNVSKSFIAGSMAGIAAKSILAPLDRVKILFQVNETRQFSFRNAAKMVQTIYVHDGFHALFRGNMLNIFRVIPYAGVQHSGFDFFRQKFHAYNFRKAQKEGRQNVSKLSNLQLVTAGSLAGGVSLIVAYPLDTLRARYMVQMGKHRYSSVFEAVAAMYKVDGMRSFTRGLVPSLLGTLPYTGIGFSLNERFKMWTLEFQRRQLERKCDESAPDPRLNPLTKFICSYLAACIAQTGMRLADNYTIQIVKLMTFVPLFISDIPAGYDQKTYPDRRLRIGMPEYNALYWCSFHCTNNIGPRRLARPL